MPLGPNLSNKNKKQDKLPQGSLIEGVSSLYLYGSPFRKV
jgi:hypothetical protein